VAEAGAVIKAQHPSVMVHMGILGAGMSLSWSAGKRKGMP